MKIIRSILLLLGAFLFARAVHLYFHEGGHAVAGLICGGTAFRIDFDYLGYSYIYQMAGSSCPGRFYTAGGTLLPLLISLVILALCWKRSSPFLAPLAMVAVLGFMEGGIYLGMDALFLAGGDGSRLGAEGILRAAVTLAGLSMVLVGAVVVWRFLGMIGIAREESALRRFIIMFGAVFPFLCLMVVKTAVIDGQVAWGIIYGVGAAVLVLPLGAGLTAWLDRRFPGGRPAAQEVSWGQMGFCAASGHPGGDSDEADPGGDDWGLRAAFSG